MIDGGQFFLGTTQKENVNNKERIEVKENCY